MIPAANMKSVILLNPASVATTATATGYVDTLGFEHATIDVLLDSTAAASNNPVVLKLSESTATNDTGTNISGFVGDSDFTIPDGGATERIVKLNVDLRTRERYLYIAITPGTAAQIVGAVANLSRGKIQDSSTTHSPHMTTVVNG